MSFFYALHLQSIIFAEILSTMANSKKGIFILFAFLQLGSLMAQVDTVTMMTYNILYYRENTSFCTATNNSASTKDDAMEDIIDHVLPDLLVVNEMGGSSSINPARLLQNALNQSGRTYYTYAGLRGTSQNLINVLYYNKDKFQLEGQTTVSKDLNGNNLVRLIDVYTLRYKDTNLAIHKDTTRINIIAAHLKAGSGTTNEDERAEATESVMAYLDSNKLDGNFLFAGDLNLYKSSEPAYQDLINYVDTNYRFYDPVSSPGTWSNRSLFASLHTQSTHTSGGCFAGGGMDDRFDFILASNEIMNNTDKIEYINGTYEALGQDGLRFNRSINSPTNNSVPSAVVTALNDMSDHLPVIMDLKFSLPQTTSLVEHGKLPKLVFSNPTKNLLRVNLSNQTEKVNKLEIYTLSGQLIREISVDNKVIIEENISNLPKGTYFIRAIYNSFQQSIDKLIKI